MCPNGRDDWLLNGSLFSFSLFHLQMTTWKTHTTINGRWTYKFCLIVCICRWVYNLHVETRSSGAFPDPWSSQSELPSCWKHTPGSEEFPSEQRSRNCERPSFYFADESTRPEERSRFTIHRQKRPHRRESFHLQLWPMDFICKIVNCGWFKPGADYSCLN